MSPDELKKTNLNNLAQSGVISADSLNATTSFKPVAPSPTSTPSASYQGLLDSITAQEQAALKQVQGAEQQGAELRSRTSSLMERLGLRASTQQQKEQQLGVPQLSSEVNKYRTNLANLEGQAATMRERVTEANRGTGRGGYDINLIESGAQRTNAIDRISTASLLQAAQGNLADARAEAERATNLEFEPKEAELKMLQQQLADNREVLSRFDSKATKALEERLRVQERQITLDKEEAKGKRDLVLQAVSFGADQNTIARMQKADSIDEAISIAGTKLRDPMERLKLEKMGIDIQQARASLQETKQDMYYKRLKSEAELNPNNTYSKSQAKNISSIFSNNKISAGTKEKVGTILGVINAAEDLASIRPAGKFAGVNPSNKVVDWLPFRNTLRQKEGIQNLGYLEGINLKIQQWASGAALTERQTEQVEKMTPNKNDTDANVRVKLNNITDFMQQQIKGALAVEGINYTPEKADLFAEHGTLEAIFQ